MPFVDKNQNREYQARWSKTRRKKKPLITFGMIPISSIKDLNLDSNVVTWSQLTAKHLVGIKTFDECTRRARKALGTRKVNRLLIATLVERACVIKHGSLPRDSRDMRLADFAKKVDLNPKTLWSWVETKRRVINKLPKTVEFVDWRAAQLTIRNQHRYSNTSPVELYARYANDPKFKASAEVVSRIAFGCSMIVRQGKSQFTASEIKELIIHLTTALSALE